MEFKAQSVSDAVSAERERRGKKEKRREKGGEDNKGIIC